MRRRGRQKDGQVTRSRAIRQRRQPAQQGLQEFGFAQVTAAQLPPGRCRCDQVATIQERCVADAGASRERVQAIPGSARERVGTGDVRSGIPHAHTGEPRVRLCTMLLHAWGARHRASGAAPPRTTHRTEATASTLASRIRGAPRSAGAAAEASAAASPLCVMAPSTTPATRRSAFRANEPPLPCLCASASAPPPRDRKSVV